MPSAVIIGAGPAGSVGAALLARQTWAVELIEQHRFPRDKVCGECISPLGIEVLKRLGVERALRRAGVITLQRSAFVAGDGSESCARLPREMWGISRSILDMILLDAAKESGVTVHQPARVEQVDGDSRRITVRDLSSNLTQNIRYEDLLIADGKSVFGRDRPAATGDLGVKAHFRNVRDDAGMISLFALPGHYCGLAPIEGGLWNVAMSVPAVRVREAGNLSAVWQRVLEQNKGLERRMRHAQRVTEWLAAPLPRYSVQSTWPANVIPLGNAAAALEPIGGEGMGLAMHSAELAAEALVAAARAGVSLDVPGLMARYRKLWRWRSVTCRAGAMIASHPRAAHAVVAMLARDDRLAHAMFALTGKSV